MPDSIQSIVDRLHATIRRRAAMRAKWNAQRPQNAGGWLPENQGGYAMQRKAMTGYDVVAPFARGMDEALGSVGRPSPRMRKARRR